MPCGYKALRKLVYVLLDSPNIRMEEVACHEYVFGSPVSVLIFTGAAIRHHAQMLLPRIITSSCVSLPSLSLRHGEGYH